jgi:hypothetical protein
MKIHQARRLLRLAAFLKRLKPHQFNIYNWKSFCGTNACVLGWACQIPAFNKLGLTIGRPGETDACRTPRYKHFFGGEAGEVFFGLTYKEKSSLFFAHGYTKSDNPQPVTVARVVKRINKIVKSHFPELLMEHA